MAPYLFISYLIEAADFVKELVRELASAGYTHWYDSIRLRQQEQPTQQIEYALRNSFALIIVVSPEANHSIAMREEYAFARGNSNLKIIRIVLDSTATDDMMVDYELDLVNQKTHRLHQLIHYVREAEENYIPLHPKPVYPVFDDTDPPVDHVIDTFTLPDHQSPSHDLWLKAALQSLQSFDIHERCDAARYLGDSGSQEAVLPLLETLGDNDPMVCKATIEALGKLRDPRAIPGLSIVMHDLNLESDLRDAAARAMGKIGHADAVPALIHTMQTDSEMYVRLTATRALGTIGDSSALTALAKTMHMARWQKLRHAAVIALGEIGDVSAHWDLLEALGDDYEEVRRDAAKIIIKLLGPIGLSAALQHADWRMREAAAWALGETRSPGVVPDLIEALSDGDRAVRKSAVWALGCIGDDRAVPDLLQRLRLDKNPRVLQLTIWALGEIGAPEAAPAITRMLEYQNEDIRRAAVTALGKISDTNALPGLIEALVDSNEEIQIAAACALGQIGHPDALEPLRAAMWNAPNPVVQSEAIKALANIPDPRVLPMLEQTLQEEDTPEVQKSAAEALSNIGTPEALDIVNRWRRSL